MRDAVLFGCLAFPLKLTRGWCAQFFFLVGTSECCVWAYGTMCIRRQFDGQCAAHSLFRGYRWSVSPTSWCLALIISSRSLIRWSVSSFVREAARSDALGPRLFFLLRTPPFDLLVAAKRPAPLLLTDGDVLATESSGSVYGRPIECRGRKRHETIHSRLQARTSYIGSLRLPPS